MLDRSGASVKVCGFFLRLPDFPGPLRTEVICEVLSLGQECVNRNFSSLMQIKSNLGDDKQIGTPSNFGDTLFVLWRPKAKKLIFFL